MTTSNLENLSWYEGNEFHSHHSYFTVRGIRDSPLKIKINVLEYRREEEIYRLNALLERLN